MMSESASEMDQYVVSMAKSVKDRTEDLGPKADAFRPADRGELRYVSGACQRAYGYDDDEHKVQAQSYKHGVAHFDGVAVKAFYACGMLKNAMKRHHGHAEKRQELREASYSVVDGVVQVGTCFLRPE